MEKENKKDDKSTNALKVFFIISNKSELKNKYKISLFNQEGIINLNNILNKDMENNINISVYSFDFIPKDLKEKDEETKKYKAKINLEYNNIIFIGLILFKKFRNNFIYEFKISTSNGDNNFPYLNLDIMEQLKIYNEVLKKLNVKQGESISIDLIMDSQIFLIGNNKKYNFDFYLEILKQCYTKKEVKTLLMMFNLNKINTPKNIIAKDYSSLLNLIGKKPEIIIKYCTEKDDKNKYLKTFYTILLYFRANYEEEKVNDLLNQKNLWDYYSEILPLNYKYFSSIELPNELINEIFKKKILSYDEIKGVFSYIKSNIKILNTINNNIDSIFEICNKNNIKLKITEFYFPKETDDLNEIVLEIGKIINFQLTKNKLFIIFDEIFWRKYYELNINKDKKTINVLKSGLFIYQTIDNLNLNDLLNTEEPLFGCPMPINKRDNYIIRKRLVMPTIGNVSVGKSYFLNSLFGIDFCQVKSDITTKFILFIRHIDGLREPNLYNLEPIKNNNDSYDFIRKGEIITGEETIKNKIQNINNDCENEEKPMFYMLEIEIKSIENKTFLKNVDFLDVPGLNESGIDYFDYLKDMIKYCLIIFSTENYNSKDSIDVINKVKNNIYIPMENFLLILNKIDKVNGKIDETIHDFKKVFLGNEDINIYRNTIVPVNSLELKSEIQIESNFYHFINYYYIEYNKLIDKSNESFLDYIKQKIRNINNIDNEKKKYLKNESKNLKDEIVEKVKSIFQSFIAEMKSKGYELMIDFDNINEINILKIFYICFTKKLLVPNISKSLQKINNYFNNINDYSLPKKNENNKSSENNYIYNEMEEHKLLKKLANFFNNTFISSKLRKYGNIVPLLINDFKILNNYILNSSLLFIPILGISNSGKSSFLNCLIQKDILTCNSSECTRRGIIIRYINEKDKISLYSIKFKKSENYEYRYYYYIKNKLLSNKIDEIKEIINIANESYPMNEEDSFFLLEINIQFLDNIDIKPEIKNNICLIDFPGHNTQNNLFFDKEIYDNVLHMSSFFIYINSGKAFKEEANKMLLAKLFKKVISVRIGDISPELFIDLCLFVFNKVDTLEEKERNLEDIQDDVKKILELPNNFGGKISCSFFSSLQYKNYLAKKMEYQIENIIKVFYSKFKYQEVNAIDDEDDLFDEEKKEDNFLKYMKDNLYKKIKCDFDENSLLNLYEIDINTSSEIYLELFNQIEKFHKENNIFKDSNYEKSLLDIAKILKFSKENSLKLKNYKESYAEDTFKNIDKKIKKSYKLKKKEFNNHLDRFFYFMNIFFRI